MVLPKVTVDFWRTDVSFVFNLFRRGDPFYNTPVFADQPVYMPLTLDRYTDDTDFNSAMGHLKTTGIPVIPVHIATLPEMRNFPNGGFEFQAHGVPSRRGARLVASLEAALGEPFEHLYSYYAKELKKDPLQLVHSADNSHPSKLGVDAMADALERMLLQHPRTARLLSTTR
jgi:hypothetical protein